MEITSQDLFDRCDRCDSPTTARMISYFTEQTICLKCLHQETELIETLREHGIDASALGGCGYIPLPEFRK